ncbi:hypothetical protein [Parvularcula maris]|uniref:MBL fold metallo-hydrolase n=1 Tax=Parvularcula maris TaxID=2965077 RepID=A0A9X2RH85_9PROT|nr:hypothetical protein [Parvularcula maris]MCQ8184665.1 hypothetical protein [Parvularcula maris]
MALTHYACTHCGGWLLWFEGKQPLSCPVCMDPRNALPENGFSFVTLAEAQSGRTTEITRVAPNLRVARETPALGLGSAGWLVSTDSGTVSIEAAGCYSDSALSEIGSLHRIAATHPHGYGAMWQLQAHSSAPVSIHRLDIPHTKAFKVTMPLDDQGHLAPSIRYRKLGGHYDGQCAFYDEEGACLFLGDALKVDYGTSGEAVALSVHKGFHYAIPLTHSEIRRYREVAESFPFRNVATTFDYAEGLSREFVLAFYDKLLSMPLTTEPIRIDSL